MMQELTIRVDVETLTEYAKQFGYKGRTEAAEAIVIHTLMIFIRGKMAGIDGAQERLDAILKGS